MSRQLLRLRPTLLAAFSFAALVGAWQAIVSFGLVDEFLLSTPPKVAEALWHQIGDGTLGRNVWVSAKELFVGFGLAIVAGIFSGVLLGWYQRLAWALDPFVWLGYSAPFVALGPIFVLTFGVGRPAVTVIAFLLSVFVITINTARGVKGVDAKLVQAARSFGASDLELLWKVVLPASVPLVMAGLRLGIGRAFVGVVIGEFFFAGGKGGVGFAISYYSGLLRTADMLATIVVIGVAAIVLTQFMTVLERRVDRWRVEPA